MLSVLFSNEILNKVFIYIRQRNAVIIVDLFFIVVVAIVSEIGNGGDCDCFIIT